MRSTFAAVPLFGIAVLAAAFLASAPSASAEEAKGVAAAADQPVRLSDAEMEGVTAGTARSTRTSNIAGTAPAKAIAIAIPQYADYTQRTKTW
jgi:hypothetical protein